MSNKIKLLWIGDGACNTGFARATHGICDCLHSTGLFDITVVAVNYFGEPHSYPYRILPCRSPMYGGQDPFGATRAKHLCDLEQFDVAIILTDPWQVEPYCHTLSQSKTPPKKVIAWLAVDSVNYSREGLNRVDLLLVWSELAACEMRKIVDNTEIDVVPLGVDSSVAMRPMDKVSSKTGIYGRSDIKVIGMVGTNQIRKRFDLAIRGFALSQASRDVDYLMHIHAPYTGAQDIDLRRVAEYFGVSQSVMADPDLNKSNYVLDDSYMRGMYSAFDVLLSTSQAEGWSLPCLEAMACGTSCIVPDSIGFSWIEDESRVSMSCSQYAVSGPRNRLEGAYTIGSYPTAEEVARSIDLFFSFSDAQVAEMRASGLALARSLSWDEASKRMLFYINRTIRSSAESYDG